MATKKPLAFCFGPLALSDKTNSDWVFIPMVTGNQINGCNEKFHSLKDQCSPYNTVDFFLFGGSCFGEA